MVEGSLVRPESLPSALVGIHTVIDCATARPEEDVYNVDWEGKKRLIQCCKEMKIQRYVFCSIKDCDKYQSVPRRGKQRRFIHFDRHFDCFMPYLLFILNEMKWCLRCL